MKQAILLCGVGAVGKTKTLKTFFGFDISKRLAPLQILERKINGKQLYAVSLSSPQELSKFCDFNNVIAILEQRIKKIDLISNNEDYTLVIPFGVYGARNREINQRCILKPINWLKSEGFKVTSVYLRKNTAQGLKLLDSFMNTLTKYVIESDQDYRRQSNEFEKIIQQT